MVRGLKDSSSKRRKPIAREFYAGITLDPKELQPLLMISTEGGMDIEEVAERNPERLLTRPLHPWETPTLAQMIDLVLGTGLRAEELLQGAGVLLKLVQAYFRFEAVTAEINPLILCPGGQGFFAGDAKFEIDDSAPGKGEGDRGFHPERNRGGPS